MYRVVFFPTFSDFPPLCLYENPQLVISWHMKAATMCEFSRQEFIEGLQMLGWDKQQYLFTHPFHAWFSDVSMGVLCFVRKLAWSVFSFYYCTIFWSWAWVKIVCNLAIHTFIKVYLDAYWFKWWIWWQGRFHWQTQVSAPIFTCWAERWTYDVFYVLFSLPFVEKFLLRKCEILFAGNSLVQWI